MTFLKNSSKNNKVVLGISGGVDSTTAVLLLLEKGYEVYGLYFNIKENGEEGRASALQALIEAYRAAKPEISSGEVESKYFIYRDVKEVFADIVIKDFCTEYLSGRTPNPCTVCNPNIKFKLLLNAANELGADNLATGHYADVYTDEATGVSYIKASASKKDQSYMLYRLPQEIVSKVMFPLALFENKSEIREIAENNGLSNAQKSDSQEICFIENDANYVEYITNWKKAFAGCGCGSGCNNSVEVSAALKEGNFIDKDGNILGKHKGIVNYTIGQRKGLGIALGKPAFVTNIDPVNNTVTLGESEDLFKHFALLDNLVFSETSGSSIPDEIEKRKLTAKVRYAAPRAEAHAYKDETGLLRVEFDKPQRAMTPGQSIVLYGGDLVIGGGRIVKTF